MIAANPKRDQSDAPALKPQKATLRRSPQQQKDTAAVSAMANGANAKITPADQTPQTGTVRIAETRAATDGGGLEFLMAMEGRVRETKNETELEHFAVNETRKLTGARQIYLFKSVSGGAFKPKAVSSMALTDPDSPMLRWVTKIVENLGADANIAEPIEFRLPAYADEADEETKTYPFKHFLWQPITLPNGRVFAGLLQARESTWPESAAKVTLRLASVYSHTWAAHVGPKTLGRPKLMKSWMWPAAIGVVFLSMLFPVSMTVLAPVEVVADSPFVVAAPIDGIINEVIAEPNSTVKPGDVLFNFDDTTVRNKKKLAERELNVAQAAMRQAVQGAFDDPKARHQLAIAKAEVDLKRADYQYAAEILDQVSVKAPIAGIVIAPDKDHWKGRPVSTGEQILKIADPSKVALRVELPVADAIVLNEDARVRVFLDAQPLQAIEANVTRASYQGKPTQTQQLAYDVHANFADTVEVTPRIGARGTAQVYGGTVPLGFYLFRRPIAAARQYLGF